jgi:hypothetical protein
MTFHVTLSGVVDAAKTEIHDAIVKLAQEFHDAVAKLEGVKVEAGNVGTPTSGANLLPPPVSIKPDTGGGQVPPPPPGGGGGAQ